MPGDLGDVLTECCGDLTARTIERLIGPGASAGRAALTQVAVERCAEALCRAAGANRPSELAEAALAVARAESDPVDGYRRAVRLLEALCSEAARAIRRRLPPEEARLAIGRLRALVGPAQLGLVAVFRAPEGATTQVGRATEGS